MKGLVTIAIVTLVLACPILAFSQKGKEAKPPPEDLAGMAWPVLEKATRSGDMLARSRAIEALTLVSGRDVSAYLHDALRDSQWIVRKAAVKALARGGDAEAMKLAEESIKDPYLPLEDEAFDLLAAFKPADASTLLFAALLDPRCPSRDKLMRALLREPISTQAMAFTAGIAKGDAYFTERLSDVRREERPALIEALTRAKEPQVVTTALKFALDKDVTINAAALRAILKAKEDEVRYGAAELLARQGDTAAVKVLLPLIDGDNAAKLRLLKAAAAAPSEDMVASLKRFLDPATPVELRVNVYQAFARAADEDVRMRIEKDLDATVLPLRAAATRAVGRLQGNRALPKLYSLLHDGSPLIRQLAAEAIGELGQAESVEMLQRALRDGEREVRLAVVRALSRIKDKSVVDVASFVIYDSDPEIRKTAILTICAINVDNALPVLRLNVEDPDPEIRLAVMRSMIYLDANQALSYFDRALGGLKPEDLVILTDTYKAEMLPFLKKAAESERAWARAGALRAIALIPDQEVTFLKEVAATNQYADVRRGAILRLEALSCTDGLDVATAVVNDKDPEVKIAALGTLARCGDATNLEALKLSLMDPEENVRVAAATGLLQFAKSGPKKAPKAPEKKPGKKQ